jgi:hypothetical protein
VEEALRLKSEGVTGLLYSEPHTRQRSQPTKENTMPSKTKSKPKNIKVTRKFLTDLANQIYSSRNRTFLRLCSGTLQNGPDPTDKRRPTSLAEVILVR